MNKTVFSRLKDHLIPKLDTNSETGDLSEQEFDVIYALLQVLADDETCDEAACRRFVQNRTRTRPGFLKEYRFAAALIEQTTREASAEARFQELGLAERNRIVAKLLHTYKHPLQAPYWRRRARVTGENLDVVFGRWTNRRLRAFVVRDLLLHYYTGAAGWNVVGYTEFPGHVRYDSEPCEVVGHTLENNRIVLAVSDGTYERLAPETLRMDESGGLTVSVKGGRQRASFQRDAYYSFCERLEETDHGIVLRLGDTIYPVQTDA